MSKNNKSSKQYVTTHRNYVANKSLNGNVLQIYYNDSGDKIEIPLIKYEKNTFVAQLQKNTMLEGKVYPKGTIIIYKGPNNQDDNNYTIIVDPKYYDKYNSDIGKGWTREGTPDIFNFRQTQQTLRDINAEDFAKYSKFLKSENNQNWLIKSVSQAVSNTSNNALENNSSDVSESNASGSNDTPTTEYDNSSPTDSTTSTSTRSFDFLDDILGTQKEASKDKTTELDPNQIANTIVNETKLNDTAISSLVSTYLNSLHRINRSYNTQTK